MLPIYLDNTSATRPISQSIEEMLPFYKERYGSSCAPHQMGQELFLKAEEAIAELAQYLGAEKDQLSLTPGGFDAIQELFISHYINVIKETGRTHLLTSATEDASILMGFKRLEALGCFGNMVKVNSQCQITADALEEAINPRTSLVSLSWASSLTGVIQPLQDLSEVCKKKGVLLHVDGSSVIGKMYFAFEDLDVDFFTFDAERIHAPQGIGALLSKKKQIDQYFRPINVPGLIAMTHSCKKVINKADHLSTETARLRDRLEKGIKEGFAEAQVIFKDVERLPHCSVIAFPGVVSEALLFALNRKKVYACMGGGQFQKLSSVLVASNVDPVLAACAISFSLSFETTEEEIDRAIETIVTCAQKLRKMSAAVL